MNYKLIYTIVVALIIVLVASLMWQKDKRKISYYTIDANEAAIMFEKEDVTIIDVRTNMEYNSGHIENAINIPVEKITKNIIDKIPDKNKYYVVYCRSGSRSREAARKLAKLGYRKVYDLGSIKNWKKELINENKK